MSKLHFLITAGPTREYIDPVRFISNASSGKMGYALVLAVLKAGHRVTLITTVENLKSQISNFKLKIVKVVSADEMFMAVKRNFCKCDCLIMAAAVADYTPIKKSNVKIRKSDKYLIIKLKPTADILKWAGESKKENQVTVGFALEDKNLWKSAETKLKEKNLDMVIANTPETIGSEQCDVWVKRKGGKWMRIAKSPKRRTAEKLIQLIKQSFWGR